jgi:hypothetical protein
MTVSSFGVGYGGNVLVEKVLLSLLLLMGFSLYIMVVVPFL